MSDACLVCQKKKEELGADEKMQNCSACREVGVKSGFCSTACFKSAWKDHKKVCGKKSPNYLQPEDVDDPFLTKGCRITSTTPRLQLKPVLNTTSDKERIFAVKREPIVADTQFYSACQSQRATMTFWNGYRQANLPHNHVQFGSSSAAHIQNCRSRYIFGIHPRKAADSTCLVQPNSTQYRTLSPEGYIGNVGITLFDAMEAMKASLGYPSVISNAVRLLSTSPGTPFRYPSVEDLSSLRPDFFYEVHPNYWNQGIMTETLEHALRYCFDVLRFSVVIIDPKKRNTASKRLAEKLGGVLVREKAPLGEQQVEYEVRRKDWYAAEKTRENGTKEEPQYEKDVNACRWCMRADSIAEVSCRKMCSWAFYCSDECRKADWTSPTGHKGECDGQD